MNKELLEYFQGDELAASVWLKKYALEGEITPDDMHRRMAKEFARIESNYGFKGMSEEEIFELFKDFKYIIPGGSVMSGLGTKDFVSLSNCTVITPPTDNYESIMDSRKAIVQLSKRRCGVGLDLSKLRPKNTKVTNSAKTSTGMASFMQGYSDAATEVAQGGRRAALMLSAHINHPDIEEFITAKQDLTKVTGANISVMVSDEFMRAVENDEDYILRFPIDTDLEGFDEYNPKTHYCSESLYEYDVLYTHNCYSGTVYTKKIRAKDLWDKLMHCAWNTAEPGILFENTIHNYSPESIYSKFKIVGLNPCAEQGLGPEDSCRLLHINLTSFVENPFTEQATFDYNLYSEIVKKAVRLGDDIVDLEIEYVDRILDKIKKEDGITSEYLMWEKFRTNGKLGRRIGLGFTGLSDTFAMMNLSYTEDNTKQFLDSVMRIKFKSELESSINLAKERGAFLEYSLENEYGEVQPSNSWYEFVKSEFPELADEMSYHGRRNISISTVAPVGTVSLMTQTTSGIEPLFMPFYERKVKCNDGEMGNYVDNMGIYFNTFVVVHPKLKEWFYTQQTNKNITLAENKMTLDDWQKIFEKSPYFGSTAPEIDWKNRITIQSIIQKYTSNAISSTINLHKETTQKEIQDLYLEAWKQGLKGITIYRDGCRDGVLSAIAKEKPKTLEGRGAPKRPKDLEADYYQIKVKGEQFIVLVGLFDGKPYEIFTFRPNKSVNIDSHKGIITKVKKGKYSFNSQHINISDLQLANENLEENAATLYSSMLLRHGVDITYIVKTAKKVNINITSFSSAMCRILSKYIKDGETGEKCPECYGKIIREGGCVGCKDCGYSKC